MGDKYNLTAEDTLYMMDIAIPRYNSLDGKEKAEFLQKLKAGSSSSQGSERFEAFSNLLKAGTEVTDTAITDTTGAVSSIAGKTFQPAPFTPTERDSAVTAYETATGDTVAKEDLGAFDKAIEDRDYTSAVKEGFDSASSIVDTLEKSPEHKRYMEYAELEEELAQYGSLWWASGTIETREGDPNLLGTSTPNQYTPDFKGMGYDDYKRYFLNGKEGFIYADTNFANTHNELKGLYESLGFELKQSELNALIQDPEALVNINSPLFNSASQYQRNALRTTLRSISEQYNTQSELFQDKMVKWETMSKDFLVYPKDAGFRELTYTYGTQISEGLPIPIGYAKKYIDAVSNKFALHQQYRTLLNEEIEDPRTKRMRQEDTYGVVGEEPKFDRVPPSTAYSSEREAMGGRRLK